MNALEVKNLTKNYKEFSLKGISFDIPKGSIMGFIGPNGAGKTTTIKAILDMINIDSGEIRLLGKQNSDLSVFDAVGAVTDFTLYDGDWKVKNVDRYLSPFYSSWDREAFYSKLDEFGVSKNKKVDELSKGQNIKLMLATALSHKAKLLILDEPTSGLDPMARDEFCGLIKDYVSNGENSVLFSTHIISDLEKIADYITFILDGSIILAGDKNEIVSKYGDKENTTLEDIILKSYKGGGLGA